MAKISPTSIKYMIYGKFKAEGAIEKPDIIGALFGQTEGLLGEDLDMRRLQKEGKIGRIEVDVESQNSKTIGNIQIPSALNKTETTLISAALETIEKIGPSTAKISVERIEDVRKNKRDFILKRAKELLTKVEDDMPKSREITHDLDHQTREGKIVKYGDDELPAGDLSNEEIIVVEGRADVLNLLRNSINNAIGMEGTKLPKTIKELSKEKKITLFVDGDRGGKLIVKNVTSNVEVQYIAFAPDGKEVEELTGKEILAALRKKIPRDEYFGNKKGRKRKQKTEEVEDNKKQEPGKKLKGDEPELEKLLEEVEDNKNVLLLDNNLKILKKTTRRGVFNAVKKSGKNFNAIVTDKATPGIIKTAEKFNITNIAAKNFTTSSEKVNLISL